MKKLGVLTTLLLVLCIVFPFCSDPENWYLNAEQSKAVLSPLSLHDGDTVAIFGRDSIAVKMYLREHLAKFTISAQGNRYWNDTTIVSTNFGRNSRVFNLSFFTTGWQEITLVSHRLHGDSISQQFRIYAVSPLKQNTLEISPGDSITLSTPSVKEDVIYVWDFRSISIKDDMPITGYRFDKVPESSIGEIYVKDKNHRSPSSFFSINGKDIVSNKPHLVIENHLLRNDTVYASTPAVQIVGAVTGATSVARITMNDIPVTIVQSNDGNYHFVQEFQNVDILSPVTVIVKVVDVPGNFTSDTFYIQYRPSVISVQPSIVIGNPPVDSSTSADEAVFIHGQILNSEKYPSGAVVCYNNDNVIEGFLRL